MGTGRQTGKSTKLIDLADAFGAVVITPTAESAKNIKHMAEREHKYVEAIPFTDVAELHNKIKDRRVVVDDADRILESIIGAHVSAMTVNAFDWEHGHDNGR